MFRKVCSLIPKGMISGCRLLSTPSRRLITKGVVSPMNSYPPTMMVPEYVKTGKDEGTVGKKTILTDYEIESMREAGRIAHKVCAFAGTLIKPGVTLDYIDKTTHEYCMSLGYYPSQLGYGGFPKTVSLSVNEVVCHAIPDSTELMDGDIVSVDLVMYVRGWHGDTCRTFCCGNVDEAGKKLIATTEYAMNEAIKICKPGVEYKEIGRVIQEIANMNRYNVVYQYVGHGIGRHMHMFPCIFHCKNNFPGKMKLNEVFTIEPMLVEGMPEVIQWEDGTVVTKDNSRCAQFEHTIRVTEEGGEIMT